MRVVMDGRLVTSSPSGVRDITLGMIRGFRSLQSSGLAELIVVGTQEDKRLDAILPHSGFMHVRLPAYARRRKADRVIVPRQTVPLISSVPVSPIFMDIGFLRIPEKYSRHRIRDITTRIAARSKKSLAISEYTALEMGKYGFSSEVCPLPIQAIHEFKWSPRAEERYILCVAAQEPHKNLVGLVRGWANVVRDDTRLVICGREGSATPELQRVVEELGLQTSVSIRSGLGDAEYEALLAGCIAYVQPSFDEGLCIPALDLAAAGAPTIVSKLGNLGHLYSSKGFDDAFDPYSVNEITSALNSVIHDNSYRERVMEWNRANVRLTDWTKVAEVALEAMG